MSDRLAEIKEALETNANSVTIEEMQWLIAEVERLRGHIDGQCPRPCNNRPDGWTIRQCVEARECGCLPGGNDGATDQPPAVPSRGKCPICGEDRWQDPHTCAGSEQFT